MTRVVEGLLHSRALAGRPSCIPLSRPKGVRALGLRYERAFGKMLGPQAILGQWWEFEDKNGHGYCQTDAMTRVNGVLCIFECKLSYVPGAWRQLECLYLPVVSEALGEIPRLVQVNRYLRGVPDARVAHSLQEAISASGGRTVLHWSGELRLAS